MRFRSAAGPPPKLLCVDDDLGARQFYQRILEAHGYKVLLAEGGVQALHLLRKQVFAAVVCDYEMPGMNGGELAAEIIVPMDHLGAEPHDQQQRFRSGVAEDFVANVDAIGVGDLRRLMGKRHVGDPLDGTSMGSCMARFTASQKALQCPVTISTR